MESLYNEGYLSYPRTETNVYHPSINLRQLIENLSVVKDFRIHCDNLLNKKTWAGPRNGSKDDKAHPPIHPVKGLELISETDMKSKVYDLISRHFLASLTKDAVGSET